MAQNTSRQTSGGLFGPGSVVWKVNRHHAVWAAGGGRALLLQVAHPLVAAAVAEHSRFQAEPIGRLRATLAASYAYLFADAAGAAQAIAAVNRRHGRVHGALPEAVGRYPASTPYDALDPDLLLWVYATSVDSWLVAYERFVGPLTAGEQEAYYEQARRPGPLWGIPATHFPSDLAALRSWTRHAIAAGDVVVGDQARELARCILQPPVWWLPAPAMTPVALATIWLLPPALRAGFGYTWDPRREALMRGVAAGSRWLVPRLPAVVRDVPAARAAERRIRRAQREERSRLPGAVAKGRSGQVA